MSNLELYVRTTLVWARPMDKDGVPGYTVIYPDGYESWCPKAAFEAAGRVVTLEEKRHVTQPANAS